MPLLQLRGRYHVQKYGGRRGGLARARGLFSYSGDKARFSGTRDSRYAAGHWLDTNQIPADRTAWGSFSQLDSEAEQHVKALVEALPSDQPAGSPEQKVGDFF